MGSRDRKTISEMVYGFYRLGHNEFVSIEERILSGISLSNNLPEVKEYFNLPDNTFADPSLSPGKVILPSGEIDPPQREIRGRFPDSFTSSKIFPWHHLLSEGVDKEAFANSFLTQPDLFLRVRPGKKGIVQDKLDESGIKYNTYEDACIALPNSTKIDALLEINKDAVVQDKSSQRTGPFLKQAVAQQQINPESGRPSVWDCCAASGGKAIMAHDLIKNIELTVSDIRSSIIQNLRVRFNEAGIAEYKSFVADLTDNSAEIPTDRYDVIIADVPCSGSGTWARTPEQLFFFKEDRLDYYNKLQKKILSRVIPFMNPGGALLYITCSVFAKENEEVVNFVIDNHGLKLVKTELLTGYKEKADTLFASLFTG